MQLQGKIREKRTFRRYLAVSWVLVAALSAPAHAGCFDFSSRISEPLRPSVNADRSGMLPQGWAWAATRGTVHQPIEAVLKDLVEHVSTKSPRVNKMEIKDLGDPRYLAKQEVHFEVDPFPFVSVKWVEVWAFNVTNGTPARPVRVVVSYEKTEGTSHIEHLCGNYVLRRDGDDKTDIFVYEEGKATGRDEKDTLSGIKGNIQALDHLKGR